MYELMLKKGSFFSSKLLSRRKKCVKIKDGNAFRMDKTKYDRFSFFCSKGLLLCGKIIRSGYFK